jgi:hypothetical protein
MAKPNDQELFDLQTKLDKLVNKQADFSKEIEALRLEVVKLKLKNSAEESTTVDEIEKPKPLFEEVTIPEPIVEQTANEPIAELEILVTKSVDEQTNEPPKKEAISLDFSKATEAFIGGNLINKIGIAITVIGVGIGGKYSIDNNLISPVFRLMIGFAVGLGLLGFAFNLKPKYPPFSAVLLGGSMAIMYFLTYLGYGLYGLIPQAAAFILMVIFTGFTTFASTTYNRVIIAHIGLLGAYAVPFLLSSNSGKVEVLFSYMFIVNLGVLALAYKRDWHSLHIPAFMLTWAIFGGWYMQEWNALESMAIPLIFGSLFFGLFYAVFMAQVIRNKALLRPKDVMYLLSNAIFFFMLGYSLLHVFDEYEHFQGLFTVINAMIHFGVATFLFKTKRTDSAAFNLIMGIVLIFITLAIPIQLEGKFITVMWLAEAAVLTWVAIKTKLSIFEKLSYPVLLFGIASLFDDWSSGYSRPEKLDFILNTEFLNSLLATIAMVVIYYFQKNRDKEQVPEKLKDAAKSLLFLLPGAIMLFGYASCMFEINVLFKGWEADSIIVLENGASQTNETIRLYQQFWTLIFSALYIFGLFGLHQYKFKKPQFTQFLFVINGLMILAYLVFGLYNISEMRDLYLGPENPYFMHPFSLLYLRYIGLAFFAIPLFIAHKLSKDEELMLWIGPYKDVLFHAIILWLASSELLHWLSVYGSANQYKLALSIFWGCYALLVIVIGMWKRKKFLRFGGIGLFTLTLVKLFFYDISHLSTISKTIVFVSLGVLLLIVSFLYNKYKHIIEDESNS